MPIALTWSEIAVRLLFTVVAGALIGMNRTAHGRAAGLRTSILVALAACIAMLQVNLLLPLAGRSSDSFVMNDLMRLPLGILSGMGFIGAGAIVRRDNFVVGVTTAASLWFLTVIGLCIGGGQIALGLVGVMLGILFLAGLKLVEDRVKQDHQGKLLIVTGVSGPNEDQIRGILEACGFRISSSAFAAANGADCELSCEVHWRARPDATKVPEAIHLLSARVGVVRIVWTPQAR
jgi:putative Mg2+ transporter-C (MgtC) family protein